MDQAEGLREFIRAKNDIASMNGIITQALANGWDVGQALYKMGYRLDPYPNGKSKNELIDTIARESHKLDKARVLLHEITMKKAAMACLPEQLALNVERFLAETSLVPVTSDYPELDDDGTTHDEVKV